MKASGADLAAQRPDGETLHARFADDVRHYLAQPRRQLPSRYLYDPLGSALFDSICRLPWYEVTRAETALLGRRGQDILAAVEPLAHIIELGSGNGDKLAVLLAAKRSRTPPLQIHLVDISRAALETATPALSAFDGVQVVSHQAPYEIGLERAMRGTAPGGRTLALFLGSNLGNFDPPAAHALLRHISGTLRHGDACLLGTDMVKSEADLLRAYDDPLGVTAAFNRNLLVRINRELHADFDLAGFEHRAIWNAGESRIEMHLVSTRRQRVYVRDASLEVPFEEGETIWTESSYKYRPERIVAMLQQCGFDDLAQWVDDDAGFALTLVEVAPRETS